MSLRTIVKYPDPALTTRAEEVDSITEEIRALAVDMIETMHDAPGVGLAANQVGVTVRVAVVDLSVGRILRRSSCWSTPKSSPWKVIRWTEGCLSLPGITGTGRSSAAGRVEALNLEGDRFRVLGKD
jgi:peptide deformylase